MIYVFKLITVLDKVCVELAYYFILNLLIIKSSGFIFNSYF